MKNQGNTPNDPVQHPGNLRFKHFSFEPGHSQWGGGLDGKEIKRKQLDDGLRFSLERLELVEEGGGDVNEDTYLVVKAGEDELAECKLNENKNVSVQGAINEDVVVELTTSAEVNACVTVIGCID